MIKEKFVVAAAAPPCQPGEVRENLTSIREACSDLARERPGLVLFPELSLSGFLPNHPTVEHLPWLTEGIAKVREWAQTIPGPATDSLVEIAKEFDILLSAGLFEDAGPVIHNTQVLAGPNGVLAATRKMHIPMFEAPFYNGGGLPPVVETRLGRIGTCICFDTLLPEGPRLLQVAGAEIVLMPFASDPEPRTVEGWIANNETLLRTRCLENGFFGLVCNHKGHVEGLGESMDFPGGGMLIGPRGEMLERWAGDSASSMVAEIDPHLLSKARAHTEFGPRFRRPELYGPLARPLT